MIACRQRPVFASIAMHFGKFAGISIGWLGLSPFTPANTPKAGYRIMADT